MNDIRTTGKELDDAANISGFTRGFTTLRGVRLHHWTGGDRDGTPVLLWHGFLETSYAWREVATALSAAGFAVLIPDMRGFGDSDKPAGDEGYDAQSLADEFRALVIATGFGNGRPVVIAAHDMGCPPALLYAAKYAADVVGVLHIEGPVMLSEVLQKIIVYEPEAMAHGSMWWWILPLAPGVPERLIVGREREFLTWFYEMMLAQPNAIPAQAVDEYLRTFAGTKGVLGAMGVYRTAFASISQTTALKEDKVRVPVIALGGRKSLAEKEGDMVALVVAHCEFHVLESGGHFLPEECPKEVVHYIAKMSMQTGAV